MYLTGKTPQCWATKKSAGGRKTGTRAVKELVTAIQLRRELLQLITRDHFFLILAAGTCVYQLIPAVALK